MVSGGKETVEDRVDEYGEIDRGSSREKQISEHYEHEGRAHQYSKEGKEHLSGTDKSKSEKGKDRKSNKKTLESRVNELRREAKALSIDETEYISAHLPSKISNYLEDYNSDEDVDRGAVAFIYNKETGEVLLEENLGTYAIPEHRWKLRFIGGQFEPHKDSTTLDTLVREFGEELENKQAKRILQNAARENAKYHCTLPENINGRLVKTDIYKIHIKSKSDWETVKASRLTHDAGIARVLPYNEVKSRLDKPDTGFVSTYEPILRDLINAIYTNPARQRTSYINSLYSLPLISTNHNHLQTANSFNRYISSLN